MKLVMFDIDGRLTQTDQADETLLLSKLRESYSLVNFRRQDGLGIKLS